jgi:predicted esterase
VRDGYLYVPESYSSDTATPLLVALHGAGGEAENWESYYQRAEDRGMILLTPDARLYTWDRSLEGFGRDVAFIDSALRHTFERCRIDPERIALAGFSEGASYSLSLGVSNGDLFTHLIAYSPGYYRPEDPIVGNPPIYVSHGVDDFRHLVSLSRDQIVPALREAGYDVTYREFDGYHEVPAEITEEALDWFLGLA